MADVDISLSGMGDVIDRLNALPRSLKKKALRKGVRAGCNIIRDDARRNAPVDTGLTERNIVTQISSTKDEVIGKVGVRGGGRKNGTNPFYWRFIELGYLHKNSGVFIKANPFMRNAQSKNKEMAITKVAEAIKAELDNMA